MAKTPAKTAEVITIPKLEMGEVKVAIVGVTGLYINRMSAKAKRQLLIGGRKKTAAERTQIKHDPHAEFKEAMYVEKDWHPHSHIKFPAMALKRAMGTAALATPGIYKTDVERLVFIPEQHVPIFGVPRLRMNVMRSADKARTPDIRTRPWFEEWATEITIRFSTLALSQKSVLTLLNNAGTICGVGDERQEKGKGSAGTFEVADKLPEHLLDAKAQWDAIQTPVPADLESMELLAEIEQEVKDRAA